MNQPQKLHAYIGTYTGNLPHVQGKAKGIYGLIVDTKSGEIKIESLNEVGVNPSFLILDAKKKHVYAVDEHHIFENDSGAVSSYSIDKKTRELIFLNRQLTHGAWPCHLCLDRTGRYLIAANYISGNVAVLPVEDDGRIGEATDVVQHRGNSVNLNRQKEPHAHMAVMDETNQFVFVPDLGIDKIMVYKLDLERGKLTPAGNPWAEIHPGGGPRHFAFHPTWKHAYSINELDSTLTVFKYQNGELETVQVISTLPESFERFSTTAAIKVHPSGRFIYASNRGHNSIAVFSCDESTGALENMDYVQTQGETPRDFDIDPAGELMLVANQDSDSIVSYHINQQTGALIPTGEKLSLPTPVCIAITSLYA